MPRIAFFVSILSFLGVVGISIYLIYSPVKLVYVDSNRLLNEYKGMQDARIAYEKKASAWKANIDTLTSEVQQHIFKYERERNKMTLKERQLSEELIRTKQKQLIDYQKAMNSQAQQEDDRIMAEVVGEINSYLKKYGKSNGYEIVLGANEYGTIAYADDGLDITTEVLEGLNSQYFGK
jgi:outer membrane protein